MVQHNQMRFVADLAKFALQILQSSGPVFADSSRRWRSLKRRTLQLAVAMRNINIAAQNSTFRGKRPIPRLPELASSCARPLPAAALRDLDERVAPRVVRRSRGLRCLPAGFRRGKRVVSVADHEQHLGDPYAASGQTLQGSFSAVSESESEVVRFSKRKKT